MNYFIIHSYFACIVTDGKFGSVYFVWPWKSNIIQFLTNYTSICLRFFRLFQAYFCCCCFLNQYASLVAVFILPPSCVVFIILHTVQTVWIFQSVSKTIGILSDCLVWRKFPFLFFTLYFFKLFRKKTKKLKVQSPTRTNFYASSKDFEKIITSPTVQLKYFWLA